MTSRLNPYLNFNGNARQALEFYHGVFGGNLTLSTFAEFGAPELSRRRPDHARAARRRRGYTIMAADVTSEMEYQRPAGFSISLSGDDDTLHDYWDRLSGAKWCGAFAMPPRKDKLTHTILRQRTPYSPANDYKLLLRKVCDQRPKISIYYNTIDTRQRSQHHSILDFETGKYVY